MSARANWLRLAATCLVALILVARATATGAQGADSVDIASLDDSAFPTLTAVVNVLDPAGKPLVGLNQDGFAVSLNDSPFPIEQVTTAVNSDIGVAVVLVVDVSGSMAGEPLAQAKAAARGFVEGLSPSDTVAVISFSDNVAVLQDFTGDRAAVFAALEGLQAEGNTALYQAATLAAARAAEATSQRRAIVLLSDGVDFGNMSTASRDDSLTWVQAIGVPFFTIGLGSGIDREYLSALSAGTGGQFLETPTAEGLSQLYQDIGSFLRSQYVITVNAEGIDETQPLTFRLDVIALGQVQASAVETLPARRAAPASVLDAAQLSVTGLVSGQKVSEPLTMSVETAGPQPLSSVAFLVDGQTVQRDSLPPFQLEIDPAKFAEGNHVLRLEATDSGGATAATELSFLVEMPAAASAPPLTVALIPVALLAAFLLVALTVVRRRRLRVSAPAVQARAEAWSPVRRSGEPAQWTGTPAPAPAAKDKPLGKLTITSGPQTGDVFFVGRRPRRIGSASHCDIVLQDEEQRVAPEDARVWISENRLMFHKLTNLGAIAFDGASGGWVVYESGDEVRIGPYRLVFEFLPPPEEESPPPLEENTAAPA
jgi:VWFA-related protein